jgi:hypothetical protein
MLKRFFNSNTGYFLNTHLYDYEGETYIGYVLCRSYVFLGIEGYKKIEVFAEKDEADSALRQMNNF